MSQNLFWVLRRARGNQDLVECTFWCQETDNNQIHKMLTGQVKSQDGDIIEDNQGDEGDGPHFG